jgi:hypothetical protein
VYAIRSETWSEKSGTLEIPPSTAFIRDFQLRCYRILDTWILQTNVRYFEHNWVKRDWGAMNLRVVSKIMMAGDEHLPVCSEHFSACGKVLRPQYVRESPLADDKTVSGSNSRSHLEWSLRRFGLVLRKDLLVQTKSAASACQHSLLANWDTAMFSHKLSADSLVRLSESEPRHSILEHLSAGTKGLSGT